MILITGGCSFSECGSEHIDTWPRHLARSLSCQHYSTAMGSQGNGLISRRVLHKVIQLFGTTDPSELLVGVMWSGHSRADFYHNDILPLSRPNVMENPTGFVDDTTKNWVIMNHHWKDVYSVDYYKKYYNDIGCMIYTLEHVLRTQWFLEKHGVRYFMSRFTNETFPRPDRDTEHLWNQVDWTSFIDGDGCYEWCRNNTKWDYDKQDNHPTTEQHKAYSDRVILPFLERRYGILPQ
jgi:hypothetical protein